MSPATIALIAAIAVAVLAMILVLLALIRLLRHTRHLAVSLRRGSEVMQSAAAEMREEAKRASEHAERLAERRGGAAR